MCRRLSTSGFRNAPSGMRRLEVFRRFEDPHFSQSTREMAHPGGVDLQQPIRASVL
jgi:hypothetical protein